MTIELKPGDVYVDKSGCICIHLVADTEDKPPHTAYWKNAWKALVYLKGNNDETEAVLLNINELMTSLLDKYNKENK